MKIKALIVTIFLAAICFSCASNPQIASHELPALERSWANAIQASYPDWQPPSFAPIDQ
ncbi:hypothetical protein PQO03_10205 [Lentisphaera profundi]|uniref:Uncharacterized protein n=1 Tax=Lentisphaera profundi TaxID=1658616 RepID=A0ABY7VS93_9BACT|nr:hypothetical protein [Lentisphaera profundi]WDE96085.1 hypothetical protein PQO03_10205 [Lentisphaera profundi]